jgi:hypothetical protein
VGRVCPRSCSTGETPQLGEAMGRLHSGGAASWYLTGQPAKVEDEENLALAGKGKFRGKKGPSGGQTSKGEKKKDFSKVKCFACHKPGHFASQCPNKKKGNKKSQMAASASTEVDEFAARFENEFSLIACLSSSASSVESGTLTVVPLVT